MFSSENVKFVSTYFLFLYGFYKKTWKFIFAANKILHHNQSSLFLLRQISQECCKYDFSHFFCTEINVEQKTKAVK